ncbi:MAG: hypothetical protein IIB00_10105, partial [candidate division Zixibacteria bacterium]|nr:hypothetical protein [candidate division Zixibacteria bacterium]
MNTSTQKTQIIFKRNLAKKIAGKAMNYIKRLSLPLNPPNIVTTEDLEKTLVESGWGSFNNFLSVRSEKPFFFQKMDKEFIRNEFKKLFPEAFETIREKSQKCHQREFNELGSGFVKLSSSEEGICWREDFKSGIVWPLKNYLSVPIIIDDDISDIKTIWELSRFQFGISLAQMEILTGDTNHRERFIALVDDWMTGNPYPLGPNWICPMELAIRSINLICAVELFQNTTKLPEDFMRKLCASLFQHGRHIKENIEFVGRGANTNHYLADLVGLLALGLFFDRVTEAKEWREFAISELEQEIISQTTEDGYCYESSMNYHLMVCEFYLHAFTLCRANALDLSVPFMRRLTKMIEFTQNSIGPNGKLPNIGDNDSGRLLKLSERPDRDPSWILLWARMEGIGPLDFVPTQTITPES